MGRKEYVIGSHYSSARNIIERLFGGVFRQFSILHLACRFSFQEEMYVVLRACCIIGNIVSGERKYEWTMKYRTDLQEVGQKLIPIVLE